MRPATRLLYLTPLIVLCTGFGPSDDMVPKPRIKLSTRQLDVVANVGEPMSGTFFIHNLTGCSADIAMFSDNNLLRVDCDRYRIAGKESARCESRGHPVTPRFVQRKITYAASVGWIVRIARATWSPAGVTAR